MDFLKDLTNFAGELKANVRRPLYEMQNELRIEAERERLAQALDQVIELDQQRQQALNPQIPLRPATFNRGDELRMAQQMKLAGIDPGAVAKDKMAQERLSMLQQARGGIDNPYAIANIANELDASPVKASGGVFYNRYDVNDPILAMTDAVRADGQSKGYQAKLDGMRFKQLSELFLNPGVPDSIKTDALNNKAITKTDRVKVVGKDGSEQYTDGILTPTGWKYAPSTDSDNQPLKVPASGEATTLAKNLRLVSNTWKIPSEKALEFLLLSKTKSKDQMRNELLMSGAKNPMFAGDTIEIEKFADDMLQVMYPEEQATATTPAPQPTPESDDNSPPQQLITQAIAAINKGADRKAVMDRIAKQGYSIEGLDL